jgi:hypothetical protein
MPKWLRCLLYLVTGLYAIWCGSYVLGAFASGLPASRWSGPFLVVWFVGSLAVFLAGVIVLFWPRAAEWLVLAGGPILEIILLCGVFGLAMDLVTSMRPRTNYTVNFGTVAYTILAPLLLVTISLWTTYRSHKRHN